MTDIGGFRALSTLLTNSRSNRSVVGRFIHTCTHTFSPDHPSFTSHTPLGPYALHRLPCAPLGGQGAGYRSMAVIREGNYTHNLFNGSQVQQRREAHKDPDQGGLLLHRREQEVQEHISESVLFFKFHHCNS